MTTATPDAPAAPSAADTTATAADQPTLLAAALAPETTPADAGAPAADAAPKDGATGEDAGAKPAEKTAAQERAAPEAYEIKPPEGVTLDAEAVAQFESVARELNMPQAEAQVLVERLAPKLQERFVAQQAQAVAQAAADWAEAAKADKEIGGDALRENLALAQRAVKQLGTPELSTLLEDSRLGNHPEVLRFLARAGKALGPEGAFLTGRAPTAKSSAQSIYANSNMNP